MPITFDTLYGVSWSHDGTKIAFGCADNTLRAIDADTGKQILYQGAHSDWVLGTVFSADARHLVSVSRDRSMKLTEVATQRFIDNITSITPGASQGRPAGGGPPAAEGEEDGQGPSGHPREQSPTMYDELLIGGSDGVPRLYKMHRETKRVIGDDANKIREYEAMPGRIFAVCFNADGSLLAAGSSLDGRGRGPRLPGRRRQARVELRGPAGAVFTVAFRPTASRSPRPASTAWSA